MFSERYKRHVLFALTLVYTLNYVDRGLIILLLQPIKNDLHLTDTQLGFVTGIAFGLFYATLGVPIARWADVGNRVTIASIAIGLWGVTVMLCLRVSTFAQLVLARVCAAVGESGCMPPTYSLLGDYFPEPGERTRAMAFYWLANPLSGLISFIAGGWLNDRYGWRITFFVMGIPAVLVAILVRGTVQEPRSLVRRTVDRERQPVRSMVEVLRALWCQPSSRHLSLAVILLFTMGLGLAPWYAAFMMRSHGMGTAELGVWLGLIIGAGGIFGVVLARQVAGRWFAHNERSQMRLSAMVVGAFCPCLVTFLLLPHKSEALVSLLLMATIFNFLLGPAFAMMQRLVGDEIRATALAVVMLLANLIGMGVGPQIVGILSDLLKPEFRSDSLRYAMLSMSCIALWAGYHFWQVGKTVRNDLLALTHGLLYAGHEVRGMANQAAPAERSKSE